MTLTNLISEEIRNSGDFISFARFMELALYAPQLGYYNAASDIFGQRGDFITAPEISPLFAKCVAKQCQQILQHITQGDILEIGAGSGVFAKDLLQELTRLGRLPKKYFIWEISETLKERQQQLLKKHCADYFSNIVWISDAPNNFSGVIIANEVMDALPCHCFIKTNQGMQERSVTYKDNQFSWIASPPTSQLLMEKLELLDQEFHFASGYISEINLKIISWLKSLGNILQQGVILLFDYGYGRREYYHPDRSMGTLMCFHQHHKQDNPFLFIGEQDITAHVDFTRVIEIAEENGLVLNGFTTQSSFLQALGIMEIAEQNQSTIAQYQQAQQIKKLLLPGEMGEIIKVMALGKNWEIPLTGFALYDRRRDL